MSGSKLHSQRHKESEENLRKEADQNKLLIKFLNFLICLEAPMRRASFSNARFSRALENLRFYAFVWLAIKFFLFSMLHGCEYAHIRYYLGDWTIFYPYTRRPAQVQVFLVVSFVHMAIKRSLFFRQPFDSSLFDFLSEPPNVESGINIVEPPEISNIKTGTAPRKDDTGGSLSMSLLLDQPRILTGTLNYKPSIYVTSYQNMDCRFRSYVSTSGLLIRDSLAENCPRATEQGLILNLRSTVSSNRDADLWIQVSSKLRRGFTYSCMIYGILLGLPLLSATTRIALLKNASSCEEASIFLRILGMIEVAFMIGETLWTAIGIHTVFSGVSEDINHQTIKIEQHFEQLLSIQNGSQIPEKSIHKAHIDKRANYYDYSSPLYSHAILGSFDSEISIFDSIIKTTVPDSSAWFMQKEVQNKTVSALVCLENHQRLLTFLGNSSYIWFIACLSFVPLIATVKANTSDNKVALAIYYTIITASSACYFTYATASARLNHRVSVR